MLMLSSLGEIVESRKYADPDPYMKSTLPSIYVLKVNRFPETLRVSWLP